LKHATAFRAFVYRRDRLPKQSGARAIGLPSSSQLPLPLTPPNLPSVIQPKRSAKIISLFLFNTGRFRPCLQRYVNALPSTWMKSWPTRSPPGWSVATKILAPGLPRRICTAKKIYDLVGPVRAGTARGFLDHPEFFLDLPLMEGSQTVVKSLSERYEIFVTSAAMDHPNFFPAKYVWLKKHFPSSRTRTSFSAEIRALSGQTL
jgi:5' nucleotidase, deoxy (Pyrimidine), cytosolic type C protein (NT5C)